MSKKEMENLDDQVLQVANSAGEARCAADELWEEQQAELRAGVAREEAEWEERRKKERLHTKRKMVYLLAMLARVAACLLAAGVFLALMLEPKFWVPVVGCFGIMTFVVVSAICIDRYCRR